MLRLTSQLVAALVIGVLGVQVWQLPFTVMSLAISVLTGFSFTALFSEPSTRLSDLPVARDETDRADLAALQQLSLNFRSRTKFFVMLAVIELLLMVVVVVQIDIPRSWLLKVFPTEVSVQLIEIVNQIRSITLHAVVTAVMFIFLEWIYTFYRLSETILAILRIRSDYMTAHRGQ